jgi:hypothetical protein
LVGVLADNRRRGFEAESDAAIGVNKGAFGGDAANGILGVID